jgi:hypothetical protein
MNLSAVKGTLESLQPGGRVDSLAAAEYREEEGGTLRFCLGAGAPINCPALTRSPCST